MDSGQVEGTRMEHISESYGSIGMQRSASRGTINGGLVYIYVLVSFKYTWHKLNFALIWL